MRGTGYAIGEILIFLAIAAIIGFLIGWLVFYRRPTQDSAKLSPVNPNHVKRLEERSRAVDGKLARIEGRANALLETLAQAPRPGAVAATTATGEAARAVDKVEAGAQQAKDTKDKVEAGTQQAKDTKDKVEAGAQQAKDKVEAGTQQAKDTKDKVE
ncbi:MAG: hypothetical protein OEP52_08105, partial [Acidimicrobiia bacterium]|nr:hypothetical protein [Acidimicrobiia bacterium]